LEGEAVGGAGTPWEQGARDTREEEERRLGFGRR
jgi:hypothetical protein